MADLAADHLVITFAADHSCSARFVFVACEATFDVTVFCFAVLFQRGAALSNSGNRKHVLSREVPCEAVNCSVQVVDGSLRVVTCRPLSIGEEAAKLRNQVCKRL